MSSDEIIAEIDDFPVSEIAARLQLFIPLFDEAVSLARQLGYP